LISYGVPQGSNPDSLLFLLYINDFTKVSQLLNFVLFADDTTVFYEHDSMEEVEEVVNKELKNLQNGSKLIDCP